MIDRYSMLQNNEWVDESTVKFVFLDVTITFKIPIHIDVYKEYILYSDAHTDDYIYNLIK